MHDNILMQQQSQNTENECSFQTLSHFVPLPYSILFLLFFVEISQEENSYLINIFFLFRFYWDDYNKIRYLKSP